jgi:hypothetical protein
MKSLAYRRAYAAFFLDYACAGERGRDELDPVYRWITEGRDGPSALQRAKYSSCGDLGHALIRALGVDPALPWLNREDETPAPGDWKSGVNLNWLCPPPIGKCAVAKPKIDLPWLGAGDVIVVNNRFGGHVMCVTRFEPGLIRTGEYGQPGGALRAHTLAPAFLNSVMSHISLCDLTYVSDPDTSWLVKWLSPTELAALNAL